MSDKAPAQLIEENRQLKQLFVDLTFCYLNRAFAADMYPELITEFKKIVANDPEFVSDGN